MNLPHRLCGALAATLALLFCAPAGAADITIKNAWMRPVRAGTATAGMYVDITTDVPLTLVGATSPMAKSVVIVQVDPKPDGTSDEKAVKEWQLPGGKETRFAYNGSRLDLSNIAADLTPGISIPMTLLFSEGPDKRQAVDIDVLVRGVILPPAEPQPKPNQGN
jgi:copper(I)-binding protein